MEITGNIQASFQIFDAWVLLARLQEVLALDRETTI
jgi:hypothetical protein